MNDLNNFQWFLWSSFILLSSLFLYMFIFICFELLLKSIRTFLTVRNIVVTNMLTDWKGEVYVFGQMR